MICRGWLDIGYRVKAKIVQFHSACLHVHVCILYELRVEGIFVVLIIAVRTLISRFRPRQLVNT